MQAPRWRQPPACSSAEALERVASEEALEGVANISEALAFLRTIRAPPGGGSTHEDTEGLSGGGSVREDLEGLPSRGYDNEEMVGLPVGGSPHKDTEGLAIGGQVGPTGHCLLPSTAPPRPLGWFWWSVGTQVRRSGEGGTVMLEASRGHTFSVLCFILATFIVKVEHNCLMFVYIMCCS